MPTFPVGVETCQIIYGKGISPTGQAQKAQLQVDLILGGSAQAVVWAGDGTPLLKLVDVFTSPVGEMGAATVAVVDQEGWLDGSGAPFSMWAYRLTERVAGVVVRVKYVQPLSGQMSIDFDMIPDGNVGLPVSAPVVPVTSVNGATGAVTVEAFSEAEANATFAPLGGPGYTAKPLGNGTSGIIDWSNDDTVGYLLHLHTGPNSGANVAAIGIGTDAGSGVGILLSQKAAGYAMNVISNPGASAPAILAQGKSSQTTLAQLQAHVGNSAVMIQARTGKGFAGGQITGGSTSLSVPSGDFTGDDIGRGITQVAYTGTATDLAGTIPSGTTISSVTDATHVILSQPATSTGTALQLFVADRPATDTQPILRVYNTADTVLFGVRQASVEVFAPVRASADGNVALTVEGTLSATASLLKVQRVSDGSARVEISAGGILVTRWGQSVSNAGNTTAQPMKITNYATTGVQALEIQSSNATPAANSDLIRLTDSVSNITSRFDKNGYLMTRKTAAPADADIGAGEVAFWFDSTNGAAKVMFKAKEAGGTIRTGQLALA